MLSWDENILLYGSELTWLVPTDTFTYRIGSLSNRQSERKTPFTNVYSSS